MQDHLTSEDIQRFLDKEFNEIKKQKLLNHISVCSQCYLELEEYRSLYQMLDSEEDYKLSDNFAQNLVSQLTPYQIPGKRDKWSDYIFAIGGIIISFIVSLYYLGFQGIEPAIKSFQQIFQKLQLMSSKSAWGYLDLLINPYLVAFLTIFAVIFVLEWLIVNKKVVHFI